MRASTSAPGGRWCAAASCRAPRCRTSPSAAGRPRAASYGESSCRPRDDWNRGAGQLQLLARLAPRRIQPGHQAPEALRMIHLDEVGGFMRGDVVRELWRQVHEAPIEADHAAFDADAPLA